MVTTKTIPAEEEPEEELSVQAEALVRPASVHPV